MPEGPEVETIRRGLASTIVGQVVGQVSVLTPKTFDVPADIIQQVVEGQKIRAVERRAKVLLWHLGNGYSLAFHLKMTGQVVFESVGGARQAGGHPSQSMAVALPDKTTRVVFEFVSGDKIFFNDMRKFGWIKLLETDALADDALISRLGPESTDPAFTVEYMAAIIRRRSRAPIKAIILDQSTVAGVGNIYADESLHLAKIHPATLGSKLTKGEIKELHKAIITILAAGTEHGGTSFASYVNSFGGKGNYLDYARVFRREGQQCPRCGAEIQKIRVAGRGTHICPHCQKVRA